MAQRLARLSQFVAWFGLGATLALLARRAMPLLRRETAVTDWLARRFAGSHHLPAQVVARSRKRPRITLVVDSLSHGRLFGGVATVLLLANRLAVVRGAELRVATRVDSPEGQAFQALLALHGEQQAHTTLAFAHEDAPTTALPIDADELFITASWWTTAACLAHAEPTRVLYVVQEDERLFYGHGDDHLRCVLTMQTKGLQTVVNTAALRSHLLRTGLATPAKQAISFEPLAAASRSQKRRATAPRPGKRRLLFYARPSHERNLFSFGLQVLEQALACGCLDSREWELVFVGEPLPPLRFAGGVRPLCLGTLNWSDYLALLPSVDLGLVLMYTPHPGYPALDLAHAGATVVTNRSDGKPDLTRLGAHVLMAELNLNAMVAALAEGARLAGQDRASAAAAPLMAGPTSWAEALQPVVDRYGGSGPEWVRG